MCLFDVNSGRESEAAVPAGSPFAAGVAFTKVLGANPNRMALVVALAGALPAATDLVFISGGNSAARVFGVLSGSDPQAWFRVETFGQLVTGEVWIATSSAGAPSVAVTEVRLLVQPEDI